MSQFTEYLVVDHEAGSSYFADKQTPEEAARAAIDEWQMVADESVRIYVFRMADGIPFKPEQTWVRA